MEHSAGIQHTPPIINTIKCSAQWKDIGSTAKWCHNYLKVANYNVHHNL